MDQCRPRSPMEVRNQMQSLSVRIHETCTRIGLPKSTKSCTSTHQISFRAPRTARDPVKMIKQPEWVRWAKQYGQKPSSAHEKMFFKAWPFCLWSLNLHSPGKTYKIWRNMSLPSKKYKSTRCEKSIDIDFMVYYPPPPGISFPWQWQARNK